jgi:hypothetical protein
MKDEAGNLMPEVPGRPLTVLLIRACKNLIERLEKGLDYKIELDALKYEIEEFNK